MKIIVIGAGAWGQPTATRLAERGHSVRLLDRWGVGNPLASSFGASRIWRVSDHRPGRVELSIASVDALERASEAAGEPVFIRRGMLWRDSSSGADTARSLAAHGLPFTEVDANDVGRFFPGLRPNGNGAVWSDTAGVVLAERSLRAEHRRFVDVGGTFMLGKVAVEILPDEVRPAVRCDDDSVLTADLVIVAAGPGFKALVDPLLPGPLPLVTRLEQVAHFGTPETLATTDAYPTFFDGPSDTEAHIYAMPTPGVGYKIGLDEPLRTWNPGDTDRTPSPERTEVLRQRVKRDLTGVVPTLVDAQVCTFTETPDGEFIIDRLRGGVIIAGGDSGEGFKFTALMGEILADLAEDRTPTVRLDAFRASRFFDAASA